MRGRSSEEWGVLVVLCPAVQDVQEQADQVCGVLRVLHAGGRHLCGGECVAESGSVLTAVPEHLPEELGGPAVPAAGGLVAVQLPRAHVPRVSGEGAGGGAAGGGQEVGHRAAQRGAGGEASDPGCTAQLQQTHQREVPAGGAARPALLQDVRGVLRVLRALHAADHPAAEPAVLPALRLPHQPRAPAVLLLGHAVGRRPGGQHRGLRLRHREDAADGLQQRVDRQGAASRCRRLRLRRLRVRRRRLLRLQVPVRAAEQVLPAQHVPAGPLLRPHDRGVRTQASRQSRHPRPAVPSESAPAAAAGRSRGTCGGGHYYC